MRRAILGGHLALVVLLCAGAWLDPLHLPKTDQFVHVGCLVTAAVSLWCLLTWRAVSGRIFDPYGIFLGAAIIFNAGQAVLEVLHLNPDGFLDGALSPATLVDTLHLVAIGLASFHLGGLLSARKQPPEVGQADARWSSQPLLVVAAALLLVSLMPTIVTLREGVRAVLYSGYAALFQQNQSTGLNAANSVLSAFLVPGVLFLLAASRGRWPQIAAATTVILGYTLVRFFMGSRGWGIMPLVAFAWLWHRRIRPLPAPLLLAGGALMIGVVFPIIRATRILAGSERASLAVMADAFKTIENPLVQTVREMGASAVTVARTLELVPATRPFDEGVGYAFGALTIFPNFFWDVHPTVARGLASDWLVRTVDPYTAALGGGLGFSFIAEAYLNFGWVGAPLALILIGYGFGRLSAWAEQGADPARLAAIASFLAYSLLFARGESALVARPLVWYALMPYFAVVALREVERRHRSFSGDRMLLRARRKGLL